MYKPLIDSKEYVSQISEKFTNVDAFIIKSQSKITLFNDYVKYQIANLTSQGETSED